MEYKTELDRLRHSCSHVMAQAVKELWPETKVTIGPAIDDGFYYDFDKETPFEEADLKKIEKKMKHIIRQRPAFIESSMPSREAIAFFKEQGEDYKVELIQDLGEEVVSIYKTGDQFVDLCKGPHVEHAGLIKAFKLLSVAGSYWRGDETKSRLQRIYGTCFFSKEELDRHLKNLEEAKKRDHRRLGTELELFQFFQESAGPGLVFLLPAGAIVREQIERYIKQQNFNRGYQPVVTPHVLKGKLWETSGHADHYKENMFFLNIDEDEYAVKPMNCPGHMLIFGSKTRSYRDLPLRLFEMGTVYRQEKTGVMHGLLRVRGFTQDDAHIFCLPDQLKTEIMQVIDFVFTVMNDFGFSDIHIELSTRPEKYIGTLDQWELATTALKEALQEKGITYDLNEGDGAFYGPKIDFKLRDALNREWQCSTVQCDFSLPERFDLHYISETGEQKRPIMIHRAILGSVERFMGTLIEHYAGAFPTWLAPTQVNIIPINESHLDYCQALQEMLHKEDIRVIMDSRQESLNKRIRDNSVKKIPYLLVIGDKEVDENKVAVRRHGQGDLGQMDNEAFRQTLLDDIKSKSLKV